MSAHAPALELTKELSFFVRKPTFDILTPTRVMLNEAIREFFQEDIKANANGQKTELKFLDVGCGEGHYAEFLAKQLGLSGTYFGVDIEQGKDFSPKTFAGINARYQRLDVVNEDIPGQYDRMISIGSLEHIPDHHGALKRLQQNLHEDTRFLVLVPTAFTYPIEFGQHGHYYRKKQLKNLLSKYYDVTFFEGRGGPISLFLHIMVGWKDYPFLILPYLLMRIKKALGKDVSYWTRDHKYQIRKKFPNRFLNSNLLRQLFNHLILFGVRVDRFLPSFESIFVAHLRPKKSTEQK